MGRALGAPHRDTVGEIARVAEGRTEGEEREWVCGTAGRRFGNRDGEGRCTGLVSIREGRGDYGPYARDGDDN